MFVLQSTTTWVTPDTTAAMMVSVSGIEATEASGGNDHLC
jgi:hypothetical protein